MNPVRDTKRGIASVIGLLTLVVGAPILLSLLGGLPSGVPSLDGLGDVFGREMTYREVNVLLAVVGWVLWAQFMWCVVVEIAAWRNNRSAGQVPLAGGSQALARTLVVSVLLLVSSFSRSAPTPELPIQVIPAVAAAAVDAPAVNEVGPSTVEHKAVKVKARDDLWGLAERHLGDPMRWREIFEMNRGVVQADGRSLQRSDLIRPGWLLQMPDDAVGVSAPVVTPPVTEPETLRQPVTQASAPTTSAPTTAAPSAPTTVASEVTNADDQQQVAKPESELPVGLLTSGAAATGLLVALTTMRRVQQRRRRAGQVVATPSESLAPVESALRIAADASDAARLDIASRALGFCFSEGSCEVLPRLDAVRIGADGIEFLFADRVDAPAGPFTVSSDQRVWTLSSDVHEVRVGSMAQLMSALLPTLSTVGTIDGASVMVDLEAALWTTVSGPSNLVGPFLDAMVLELSTNIWSDYLTVVVVGGDERQGRFERASHYESLDEARVAVEHSAAIARQMNESGLSSTTVGRIEPGNDGWAPTIVVVREDVSNDEIRSLLALGDFGPGKSLAIVTTGERPDADRTIAVSCDSVAVTPPGIRVQRTGLAVADVNVVHDLLDQTDAEAVDQQPAVIDLRTEPRSELVDVPSVRVLPTEHEVLVRVLGPVSIEGGVAAVDRPKSVELVAFLGLHPSGVTDDRLKTALWPDKRVSPGSFHSTTSRARSRLGEASDGTSHLLPVNSGMYGLHISVAVDAVLFERAARSAQAVSKVERIEMLTTALEYVKGAPFSDTSRGYQWAYNEGIVGQLESMVANAAHALSELSFEMGDNERGHWAARQGVLASPGWEPLYRLRMTAYDKEGNPAGVRAVMDELVEVVEAIEPYDSLHPETVGLWKLLDPLQRLTRTRQ